MNLYQLKVIVGAMFDKNEPASLTLGGVDMFLVAANSVRRDAELAHDFEYSRITAVIDIDTTTGGSLVGATLAGDATAGIKQITTLTNSAGVPVDFMRVDQAFEMERDIEDTTDWITELRYRPDWLPTTTLFGLQNSGVVQRGSKLYLYPLGLGTDSTEQTIQVNLEGFGLLPDYTDDMLKARSAAPQDFMLNFGGLYMQWAIVNQLNYIYQKFVPRTEGALTAPQQAMDLAWRNFITWNNYLTVAGMRARR